MKKVKTITSHAGLARWLAEVSEEPVAWLARVQVEEIPSPYRYSPVVAVYEWNGRKVAWFETRHRRYEVFEVPAELLKFKTEAEAEEWHIRFRKRSA